MLWDPGSWFFFIYLGFRILNLGSWISDPTKATKQRGKKFVLLPFCCSNKFYKCYKIVNYFIFYNVGDPWHFDFSSLKNDVNVPSKTRVISKITLKKNFGSETAVCVRERSVTDPQNSVKISDPHTGIFLILIVQVSQYFRDRWLHQLAQLQDCRGCGRSTGNHKEVSQSLVTVRIRFFLSVKYKA